MTLEFNDTGDEYWEKKLKVSRNDPNFGWYVEQATANEIRKAHIKIVPAGKSLGLPKLKDVQMPLGGAKDD